MQHKMTIPFWKKKKYYTNTKDDFQNNVTSTANLPTLIITTIALKFHDKTSS